MGGEKRLLSQSAPRLLSSIDAQQPYRERQREAERERATRRRRAARGGMAERERQRLGSMDGWADPGLESFVRGETPLWTEIAVPRPKTFNRDGRSLSLSLNPSVSDTL
jgi:hypothetical protein